MKKSITSLAIAGLQLLLSASDLSLTVGSLFLFNYKEGYCLQVLPIFQALHKNSCALSLLNKLLPAISIKASVTLLVSYISKSEAGLDKYISYAL